MGTREQRVSGLRREHEHRPRRSAEQVARGAAEQRHGGRTPVSPLGDEERGADPLGLGEDPLDRRSADQMAVRLVAALPRQFGQAFERGVFGAEFGSDALPDAARTRSEADEVGLGFRDVDEMDRRAGQQRQCPLEESLSIGARVDGDQRPVHAARNEGAPGGIAAGVGMQVMNGGSDRAILLLFVGGAILVGILAKAVLRRLDVPALLGFLAVGVACGALDREFGLLSPSGLEVFDVLADIGIVCILFRVGLESDLGVLARELPRAVLVLVGNVVLSFALVYAVGRACGLGILASLLVAVALSATSIALSTYVFESAGMLKTRTGALVLDTAQLDDLLTVLFLVLLLALAPALASGADLAGSFTAVVGSVATRALLFGALCYGLARFGEARITRSFRKLRHGPEPILVLIGVAMVVAAIAGALGFSLAIGAMFAGLVFSRDPRAVRLEASFDPIHALFAPFFFVAVGMRLDVGAMPGALGLGLALTAAAVVGKVVGSAIPVWPSLGRRRALAVGVSMVPRAEIALFVAEQGRIFGDAEVPEAVHGAVLVVVALTCTLTPPVLRRLLGQDPDAALDVGAGTGCDRRSR